MMVSRLPAGVIPTPLLPNRALPPEPTSRPDENTRVVGRKARQFPHGDTSKISASDPGDHPLSVCPRSHPYLLTLRGYDIRKDSVLYPLRFSIITLGRKPCRASQLDHIHLLSQDVLDIHCRVHRRTPPVGAGVDLQRYCYCLQVEVVDQAVVFVNGERVEGSATVRAGDVLGVGDHYIFLFKDPTRGYDIPVDLPWYPTNPSSLYAKVNKSGGGGGSRGVEVGDPAVRMPDTHQVHAQQVMEKHDGGHKGHMENDGSTNGDLDTTLTLTYALHREREVLEYIANLKCSDPSQFPLTPTVLLLGCYGYACKRFPRSHQATFFRTLHDVIRNRAGQKLGFGANALSYVLPLFFGRECKLFEKEKGDTLDIDDADALLDVLCWLSNIVRIHSHLTSADFRSHLGAPQPGDDVRESVLELCKGLEEMISFTFQQSVYCMTKVLFAPVAQVLHPPTSPTGSADCARAMSGMERVLQIFNVTLDVSQDVSLHRDVIIQLLMYLLFFVTTTIFNKLITKGGEDGLLSWPSGVRLQSCVSCLENWVSGMGLETQYLRVAQPLVSLVDLLATSTHTLATMDWASFRTQFPALSEVQLQKILAGYQFCDGRPLPAAWVQSPGVQTSQEVSLDLSSHPPFVLPQHGPGVDMGDTFPPSVYTHRDTVISLFTLSHESLEREGSRPTDMITAEKQSDLGFAPSRLTGSGQGPALSFNMFPRPQHGHHDFTHQTPAHTTAQPRDRRTASLHDLRGHGLSQRLDRPDSDSMDGVHGSQGPPLPLRCRERTTSDNTPSSQGPPLPQRLPSWDSGSLEKRTIDSVQDPQSPPVPQRHRHAGEEDTPPPLPPRHPSPRSAGSVGQPPVTACKEADVFGPRRTERVSERSVSSEGSLQASADRVSASGPWAKYSRGVSFQTEPVSGILQESEWREPGTQTRFSDSGDSRPIRAVSSEVQHHHQTLGSVPDAQLPSQPPGPLHHNPLFQQQAWNQQSMARDPSSFSTGSWDRRSSQRKKFEETARQEAQDKRTPSQPRTPDPRRRPLPAQGPLSLQDKRILNNIPPLHLPPEDLSLGSDSAISDDVFVHSSAEYPPVTLGSSARASEFRRFSTGMLSQARAGEEGHDKPHVISVDMRSEGPDDTHLTVDGYPDDTYIDVLKETALHPGGRNGQLEVLPLDSGSGGLTNGHDDGPSQQAGRAPTIRYRHTMPQERDTSTKGEITGEVFTLTLLKEGARLGMGLIDGMHTPLRLPGIYVRNVLPGTPAALCGHIRVGDRLLAINGRSIVGWDYHSVMKLIRSTGPRLNLLIAKCDRSVAASISAS